MAADPKSNMAQDKEPQKEAEKPPRKTFKDYLKSYGAHMKDYATGPLGYRSIGRELAYAVTDIHQKVVEEGMYGKVVTPQQVTTDERSETIIEKKGPPPKGDPLGRTSAGESRFKQRCREALENGGKGPDGPGRGPERGPER